MNAKSKSTDELELEGDIEQSNPLNHIEKNVIYTNEDGTMVTASVKALENEESSLDHSDGSEGPPPLIPLSSLDSSSKISHKSKQNNDSSHYPGGTGQNLLGNLKKRKVHHKDHHGHHKKHKH